jgi:hypothetical protein
VHSKTLLPGEVVDVDGMPVTGPERTAFDLGRWTSSRLRAVQRLDALVNATDVKVNDIEAVMAEHRARSDSAPSGIADRYTALLDLGWTIIRVSSELLRHRQGALIARVVAAMQAAGWRP